MLADGKFLLVRGAGDGAVGACEVPPLGWFQCHTFGSS